MRSRSTGFSRAGSRSHPGEWVDPSCRRSCPGAMPTSRATPISCAAAPVSREPLGPTHTSTGTDDRAIWLSRSAIGASETTTPVALVCSTRALAPGRLGVGHRWGDGVDHDRVEQAAHLEHGDEAGRGAVAGGRGGRVAGVAALTAGASADPRPSSTSRAAGSARADPGWGPPRTATPRTVGGLGWVVCGSRASEGKRLGSCAVLRSISRGHRGREGRRRQNHGQRRPGPGGGAARAAPP